MSFIPVIFVVLSLHIATGSQDYSVSLSYAANGMLLYASFLRTDIESYKYFKFCTKDSVFIVMSVILSK